MITLELITEDFGETLVKDIRAKLIAEGVTFGGGGESKLGASTRFEIVPTSKGLEFHLIMPKEWYWVNYGREPGNVNEDGRKSIEEWGERKGIIDDFNESQLIKRKERREKNKRKYKKALQTIEKMPFSKAKIQFGFAVANSVRINGYEGNEFLSELLKDGRIKILNTDMKEFITEELKVSMSELKLFTKKS